MSTTSSATKHDTKHDTRHDAGAGLSVLIADKFEESGIQALEAHGCRVTSRPELTADDLADAVRELDPNVLVVRSTKVHAPVFDAGQRLSLVIRAGAGYDTIDVAAASDRAVFVANCPGKNSVAVAELAWALILACDRRLPEQTAALQRGEWNKKGFAKARGLHGRTLGVVGLGRIGHAVAERGRAFGMPVVAWSRSLTPERAEAMGYEYCATPLDVARRADVISLHVASKPETKHLVNAEFCSALRPGTILINTTRGAVVDEAALLKAVRDEGVRVGLDVYASEPAAGDKSFSNPLLEEPNVVGTHHVGASTDQAQQAIAGETVRILTAYADTGTVPNCVNRAARSAATCLLTVRHLNRAGVLAHVFGVLSTLNVEEMENIIFAGAGGACARIQLDAAPSAEQLDAIRQNQSILTVSVASV
jgi:D-3-phosphoglycerate dehydrogenase